MTVQVDCQLMDFYRLAVEMADRASGRRTGANAIFVSVQTAIVAAFGFLAARTPEPPDGVLLAVPGVGILGAGVWYALLRSYRLRNRAKFEVILELEKRLPAQIFTDERASLTKGLVKKWGGGYVDLGSVERLAHWHGACGDFARRSPGCNKIVPPAHTDQ